MIPWALQSVWHFIASSASVATLIGCAAVAVAVLEPKFMDVITDLRKWAIVVAVIAFSYTSVAGKFYHDGLTEKQRQWDAALVKEIDGGEKARTDAEPTDGMRNDRWNRDKWGQQPDKRTGGSVRWLETHRLFGK
jgi:cytochrome bd-type quinol oxidase subunit 1